MRTLVNDEKKRVTIYNVAKEAGVSLATVSRVINDSDVVREDTKKKVQEAIIKLGYKPNAVAQGLALKKTTSISLVIPDSSFTYIGKVINGLLDVAKIYKYNITLHTSTSGVNEMHEIIDNVIKNRADGLILYNDAFSPQELQTLSDYQIPMVYLGTRYSNDMICSVFINYYEPVHDMVADYLNRGIEDIVIIDDRKNPSSVEQMVKATEDAFREHGKSFNGLIRIPDSYHSSYDFLTRYFSSHRHQLIITYRDSQAIAVLNTCSENGIKIPEETELVCVKDSRYTEMVRPQISSFVTPAYDAGALAMRIMTKMLNGDKIVEKEFELNTLYKPRSTTK